MTIPAMRASAAALLLVGLVLSGCAATGAGRSQAGAAQLRAGRAQRAHMIRSLHALKARVERLGHRVDHLESAGGRVRRGLGRLSGRLRGAVDELRKQTSRAATEGTAARSQAADAIARIQQVSRQVTVLRQRLDYHLRHAGGA